MKSWIRIALAAACLAAAGCRGDMRRNTAALEQELRLQEDRIYELQDSLERSQQALDDARRDNEVLRSGSPRPLSGSSAGSSGGSRSGRSPVEPEPPSLEPEPFHLPGDKGFESTIPKSLLPADLPRGESSPLPDSPNPPGRNEATPLDTTPEAPPSPPSLIPPGTGPDSAPPWTPPKESKTESSSTRRGKPETISLGEVVDGVSDASGWMTTGAGLTLLIQPRDAWGRPVTLEGPVSAVVIDPSRSGSAARVARWDFPADMVAQNVLRSGSTPGFLLSMPWPDDRPKTTNLLLYVRYTTPDGRRLQTDRPIRLTKPEQAARPAEDRPPRRLASRPTWSPERSIY